MTVSVSHSEMSTYLECQKKWDLIYNKGFKIENIHATFGVMCHKVLETRMIPDEFLYPELKVAFKIDSWHDYFKDILDELDLFLKDFTIIGKEVRVEHGIIDLVCEKDGSTYIFDYKFSTDIRGQLDLVLDEQLYLYADRYKCDVNNTYIGYITIRKSQYGEPRVLNNGSLSRDKAQNTNYRMYLNKINELHLSPGEYEDILDHLKSNKMCEIVYTLLDKHVLEKVLENCAKIEKDMQKGYVLEKFSNQCKRCPLVSECKLKN